MFHFRVFELCRNVIIPSAVIFTLDGNKVTPVRGNCIVPSDLVGNARSTFFDFVDVESGIVKQRTWLNGKEALKIVRK
jgi:hypothetical protein